jgi:hypothetical protein
VSRFPANCLLVAVLAGGPRMRMMHNRSGRLHFYWIDQHGLAWEFYTKGASRCSYLRNAFRFGEIKRMPSGDEILTGRVP